MLGSVALFEHAKQVAQFWADSFKTIKIVIDTPLTFITQNHGITEYFQK